MMMLIIKMINSEPKFITKYAKLSPSRSNLGEYASDSGRLGKNIGKIASVSMKSKVPIAIITS